MLSREARADDQRVTAQIAYVAPESGCPDEASFRNLVAARLGYDPFEATSATRVLVEIKKHRGKLQGHAAIIRGDSPAGSRDLDGELDRCEPLATAIATSVAIALDPLHREPPEPPTVPPVAQPAPSPTNTVVVVRERDAPHL